MSEEPVSTGTKVARFVFRTLKWGQDHVPFGVRSVIGVLFLIGGVFGFLPILGFWMIPLGLAFIALDVPPLTRRVEEWMRKLHARAYPELPYPDVPTSNQ